MTRKQAISKAIELLQDNDENKELISKLQEIKNAMPMYQWTKESILDTLENYIVETGKLPNVQLLTNENGFPSRTAIEAKFNVTSIVEFYKTYFSVDYLPRLDPSKYREVEDDSLINIFKENYDRIKEELNVKKVYLSRYDMNRTPGSPIVKTIMFNCGCKTYEELLIKCGYAKPKLPFSTNVNFVYERNEKNNEDLMSILSEIEKDIPNRKK